MKVLQINTVCGTGSTGRIATDIHKILIDEGHESYIAYGRDLPKNCNNAIRIGSKVDNYSHALKTRIFDKHGFGSIQATHRFIEKVREIDPDIIHLHNIHGYYINIEVLFNYLKEANKPVVWTLHDCWSFTGHCAYFDYAGCEKWKSGCYNCPEKKSYPSSLIIDNSQENYKEKRELFNGVNNLTIITPSKWLAEMVEESFLNEYPVKVINNGIDLDIFKSSNSKFRDNYNLNDKFIILGVASIWERRKGLQYFKELSNTISDDEVIVLVGVSKNQIRDLPQNIIAMERTNNTSELAEIYSTADVFVNPTLEEVMGLTNIEALACGTPVITFNSGGSPECINEQTGIIVEKGNMKALVTAIESIKNNKNIMSDNCVQRARLFDKNDKFKEYVQLYKSILT